MKILLSSALLLFSISLLAKENCKQKFKRICGSESIEQCLQSKATEFKEEDVSCVLSASKDVSERAERCFSEYQRVCKDFVGNAKDCYQKNKSQFTSDCRQQVSQIGSPQATAGIQKVQQSRCYQRLMAKCPIGKIDIKDIKGFQQKHLSCFQREMKKLKGQCEKEFKNMKL